MKALLATLFLATSITANATERGNPLQGSSAISSSIANQESVQQQTSTAESQGGNSSVNVDNDTKMPASSAVAPSVGTNNNCLIATPSSVAGSILIGSISKTTGFHYSGLCLAYRMNDMALVEKLMCLEDRNYAKLNPNCGK